MTKLLALLFLASCATDGTIEDKYPVVSHSDDSPWTELDRIQREGPPRYTSRLHSCPKMRYGTLGNVLASRGVQLSGAAGQMYAAASSTLGAPNYPARTRENIELGLAMSTKVFDILGLAAQEIITAMPSRPECMRNGVPAQLFDANNRCVASGVSCLIGVPATSHHLAVCNETVARAENPTIGKQLAVAVLAAAAHTCE